jgi:hypothetical protein
MAATKLLTYLFSTLSFVNAINLRGSYDHYLTTGTYFSRDLRWERQFVLKFELRLNDRQFDELSTVCTDPNDEHTRMDIWTFLAGTSEVLAFDYLEKLSVSHGVKLSEPGTWILDDTPMSFGWEERRMSQQKDSDITKEEAHRRLRFVYSIYISGVCRGCSTDNVDGRRGLGDSNGNGKTLSDAVAKGLKWLLKAQCGLVGLKQVTVDLVEQ